LPLPQPCPAASSAPRSGGVTAASASPPSLPSPPPDLAASLYPVSKPTGDGEERERERREGDENYWASCDTTRARQVVR